MGAVSRLRTIHLRGVPVDRYPLGCLSMELQDEDDFDIVAALPPMIQQKEGGMSSPELAFLTPEGRVYRDPLPWCPLLGSLGIPKAGFVPGFDAKSVTTWLGYVPKDRLIPWTGMQVAEAAWEGRSAASFLGPYLWKRWIRDAPDRIRDRAGERGGIIHDFAEDGETILRVAASELLAGHPLPDEWLANENVGGYLVGLQKFFQDYAGIIPLWVEVSVFSRTHGYAGTVDLICWLPGYGIVIIDWKTSRYVLPKFSFQLGCYRWADYGIIDGVRVPIPRTGGAYVVQLRPGPEEDPMAGTYVMKRVDSEADMVADVIVACKTWQKWDHPSRIGPELPRPVDIGIRPDGIPAPPPRIDWMTTDEIVAAYAEASRVEEDDRRAALARDPIEVWNEDRRAHRAWELDYVRAVIPNVVGAARTGLDLAVRAAEALPRWWTHHGLPKLADQRWDDPDFEPERIADLCASLAKLERDLELPFSVPAPQTFDWRCLLDQRLSDHTEAAACGWIIPDPSAPLDRYVAAPQVLAPRVGVVAARRGHSVDPKDFDVPRDPDAVALEASLIEMAKWLPSDLLDELNTWTRQVAIPPLTSRAASRPHLALVEPKLHALVATMVERMERVGAALRHFDDAPSPSHLAGTLIPRMNGVSDPDAAMTGKTAERVVTMCDAVVRGDLIVAPNDNGEPDIVCRADVEKDLIVRFGGKAKARSVASATARRLGEPLPRSMATAAESAVLVAFMTDPAFAGEESVDPDNEEGTP